MTYDDLRQRDSWRHRFRCGVVAGLGFGLLVLVLGLTAVPAWGSPRDVATLNRWGFQVHPAYPATVRIDPGVSAWWGEGVTLRPRCLTPGPCGAALEFLEIDVAAGSWLYAGGGAVTVWMGGAMPDGFAERYEFNAARAVSDFDGDRDAGTDADIEAFYACLTGNCCGLCGSADWDGDGDSATDADIESFWRTIAGG